MDTKANLKSSILSSQAGDCKYIIISATKTWNETVSHWDTRFRGWKFSLKPLGQSSILSQKFWLLKVFDQNLEIIWWQFRVCLGVSLISWCRLYYLTNHLQTRFSSKISFFSGKLFFCFDGEVRKIAHCSLVKIQSFDILFPLWGVWLKIFWAINYSFEGSIWDSVFDSDFQVRKIPI